MGSTPQAPKRILVAATLEAPSSEFTPYHQGVPMASWKPLPQNTAE
jgi:hypothetical protein